MAPPKSSEFANDAEGLAEFVKINTEWSQTHPEEADKIRKAKIEAEDKGEVAPEPAAALTYKKIKISCLKPLAV